MNLPTLLGSSSLMALDFRSRMHCHTISLRTVSKMAVARSVLQHVSVQKVIVEEAEVYSFSKRCNIIEKTG